MKTRSFGHPLVVERWRASRLTQWTTLGPRIRHLKQTHVLEDIHGTGTIGKRELSQTALFTALEGLPFPAEPADLERGLAIARRLAERLDIHERVSHQAEHATALFHELVALLPSLVAKVRIEPQRAPQLEQLLEKTGWAYAQGLALDTHQSVFRLDGGWWANTSSPFAKEGRRGYEVEAITGLLDFWLRPQAGPPSPAAGAADAASYSEAVGSLNELRDDASKRSLPWHNSEWRQNLRAAERAFARVIQLLAARAPHMPEERVAAAQTLIAETARVVADFATYGLHMFPWWPTHLAGFRDPQLTLRIERIRKWAAELDRSP